MGGAQGLKQTPTKLHDTITVFLCHREGLYSQIIIRIR